MQHVHREHSDYDAVMLDALTAETGSLINFVRHSALNSFGVMVWIVQCNLPLILREPRSATVSHQFALLFVLSQSLICVFLVYVTQLL